MTLKIFEKITARLIESGTISAEDKDIYEYGLKHIATMFLNISTTLVIGFIFGMIWQSGLFMVSYIPLRSYAGGYHARTPLKCYIFSVILTICVLLIIKYIPYNNISLLILLIISGVFIFIFAPVGDENKPLDELETKVFKKRTRIILFIESALIGLFMFLGLTWIMICMTVSIIIVSFMVAISTVKNKINFQKIFRNHPMK